MFISWVTIILLTSIIPIILFFLSSLINRNVPYKEKNSVFECGYHSFLGQNRTQFSISFFVFALLFLLFDLEILLIYPYIVSAYNNESYGLFIMLFFFIMLTLGFAFEICKKALIIDTKQDHINKISRNMKSHFISSVYII